jgi:hypothetical protein
MRAHPSLIIALGIDQCKVSTFALELSFNELCYTRHAKSDPQPSVYSDQAISLPRKHHCLCISILILTLQLPAVIGSDCHGLSVFQRAVNTQSYWAFHGHDIKCLHAAQR